MTKEELQSKVQEYHNKAKEAGYDIFGTFLIGSQNYNLDIYSDDYTSDVDVMVVVLSTFDDVLYNRTPIQRIGYTGPIAGLDSQLHFLTFHEFMSDLIMQNIRRLEYLFTDYYVISKPYKELYNKMRLHREAIAKASPYLFATSSVEFVKITFASLVSPYYAKIAILGYNPKRLHHLARCGKIFNRYLNNESFEDCLKFNGEERDELLMIKTGNLGISAKEAILRGENYMNNIQGIAELIKQQHPQEYENTAVLDYLRTIRDSVQKQALKLSIKPKVNYLENIIDNIDGIVSSDDAEELINNVDSVEADE